MFETQPNLETNNGGFESPVSFLAQRLHQQRLLIVQELIEEHRAFTSSIGDAEQEKNAILQFSGTAADPETGNHYTSVSPNVSHRLFFSFRLFQVI